MIDFFLGDDSGHQTPAHIAGKFGGKGDKCPVCDKTVYATEKLVLEDANKSTVLHKQCLK